MIHLLFHDVTFVIVRESHNDKNLNFNLERKIGVYLIHSISLMTAKSPPVDFAKDYRLLKSLYEYIIKKFVF